MKLTAKEIRSFKNKLKPKDEMSRKAYSPNYKDRLYAAHNGTKKHLDYLANDPNHLVRTAVATKAIPHHLDTLMYDPVATVKKAVAEKGNWRHISHLINDADTSVSEKAKAQMDRLTHSKNYKDRAFALYHTNDLNHLKRLARDSHDEIAKLAKEKLKHISPSLKTKIYNKIKRLKQVFSEDSMTNTVLAAVIDPKHYDHHLYHGPARVLKTKKGKTITLKSGHEIAFRSSTSNPSIIRMIHSQHGPSIIFTMTTAFANNLKKNTTLKKMAEPRVKTEKLGDRGKPLPGHVFITVHGKHENEKLMEHCGRCDHYSGKHKCDYSVHNSKVDMFVQKLKDMGLKHRVIK